MTEEEAKTKWCPFVRAYNNGGDGPFNRWLGEPEDHPQTFCIGSACMAWRWDWDDDGMRTNAERKSGASKVGYCGLAGKP